MPQFLFPNLRGHFCHDGLGIGSCEKTVNGVLLAPTLLRKVINRAGAEWTDRNRPDESCCSGCCSVEGAAAITLTRDLSIKKDVDGGSRGTHHGCASVTTSVGYVGG